jgi:Protein of unknown function (DUF2509).
MKIYSDANNPAFSGFSAIVMVFVLMTVGLILLTGFNLLINSWQKTVIMEIDYYKRFNHASSSLTWGIYQKWATPTTSWQCLTQSTYQLKACIKKSALTIDNYVLVRGEASHVFLFTLAHYENNQLVVEKGHWLDYCPEKKSSNCE